LTLEEARFEIDRQLVMLAAQNGGQPPELSDIRFFLYPHESCRWCLACAERSDGGEDIQVLFELPVPAIGGHLNENQIREQFFDVPSGARH
jgi:hypothetical protein